MGEDKGQEFYWSEVPLHGNLEDKECEYLLLFESLGDLEWIHTH